MKLDQYYTPNEIVEMLNLPLEEDDVLFEPCVGTGQIPANIEGNWITNDITTGYDATVVENWPKCIDWTITNPPFCSATPILKNAIERSKRGVAFLVRLSYLEPTKDRYELFTKHPPTSMVVCPRPIFLTPNGYSDKQDKKYKYNDKYNTYHDTQSCIWIIWDKNKKPMDMNWMPKPSKYNWIEE